MSVDNPEREEIKCQRCGAMMDARESCWTCGWTLDGDGFTEIQAAVIRGYEGGEYSGLLPEALERGVGDGLFEFFMDELGPANDCDNLETAIERAETIQREATEVLRALRDLEARRDHD